MTKIEEMQRRLTQLLARMQAQLDEDKLSEATATRDEIRELNEKITAQLFVDEMTEQTYKSKSSGIPAGKQTSDNASFIRACFKKVAGKPLTEVENALLLPTSVNIHGANGEGYILPEDIQTKINRRIREFRSFRSVLGYVKTTALTGSYAVENLDSLTGLVDFADGTDGTLSDDISFTQVTFSLKEKAAFIKISNTLIELTDNDLIAYIVEVFAKKAVITENALAIAEITRSKTVKTFEALNELKHSFNTDLDPAAYYSSCFVTNQDGFDYLDNLKNDVGDYYLQPDPTDSTKKRLFGYRVEVFSNAQLPSTTPTSSVAGYAPIYFGDLEDGVKFFDLGKTAFATSQEAGFMSNTTIARLIEFVDVEQCDGSDKCYIVGKIKVCEPTA